MTGRRSIWRAYGRIHEVNFVCFIIAVVHAAFIVSIHFHRIRVMDVSILEALDSTHSVNPQVSQPQRPSLFHMYHLMADYWRKLFEIGGDNDFPKRNRRVSIVLDNRGHPASFHDCRMRFVSCRNIIPPHARDKADSSIRGRPNGGGKGHQVLPERLAAARVRPDRGVVRAVPVQVGVAAPIPRRIAADEPTDARIIVARAQQHEPAVAVLLVAFAAHEPERTRQRARARQDVSPRVPLPRRHHALATVRQTAGTIEGIALVVGAGTAGPVADEPGQPAVGVVGAAVRQHPAAIVGEVVGAAASTESLGVFESAGELSAGYA
jgi:hypothetical protein